MVLRSQRTSESRSRSGSSSIFSSRSYSESSRSRRSSSRSSSASWKRTSKRRNSFSRSSSEFSNSRSRIEYEDRIALPTNVSKPTLKEELLAEIERQINGESVAINSLGTKLNTSPYHCENENLLCNIPKPTNVVTKYNNDFNIRGLRRGASVDVILDNTVLHRCCSAFSIPLEYEIMDISLTKLDLCCKRCFSDRSADLLPSKLADTETGDLLDQSLVFSGKFLHSKSKIDTADSEIVNEKLKVNLRQLLTFIENTAPFYPLEVVHALFLRISESSNKAKPEDYLIAKKVNERNKAELDNKRLDENMEKNRVNGTDRLGAWILVDLALRWVLQEIKRDSCSKYSSSGPRTRLNLLPLTPGASEQTIFLDKNDWMYVFLSQIMSEIPLSILFFWGTGSVYPDIKNFSSQLEPEEKHPSASEQMGGVDDYADITFEAQVTSQEQISSDEKVKDYLRGLNDDISATSYDVKETIKVSNQNTFEGAINKSSRNKYKLCFYVNSSVSKSFYYKFADIEGLNGLQGSNLCTISAIKNVTRPNVSADVQVFQKPLTKTVAKIIRGLYVLLMHQWKELELPHVGDLSKERFFRVSTRASMDAFSLQLYGPRSLMNSCDANSSYSLLKQHEIHGPIPALISAFESLFCPVNNRFLEDLWCFRVSGSRESEYAAPSLCASTLLTMGWPLFEPEGNEGALISNFNCYENLGFNNDLCGLDLFHYYTLTGKVELTYEPLFPANFNELIQFFTEYCSNEGGKAQKYRPYFPAHHPNVLAKLKKVLGVVIAGGTRTLQHRCCLFCDSYYHSTQNCMFRCTRANGLISAKHYAQILNNKDGRLSAVNREVETSKMLLSDLLKPVKQVDSRLSFSQAVQHLSAVAENRGSNQQLSIFVRSILLSPERSQASAAALNQAEKCFSDNSNLSFAYIAEFLDIAAEQFATGRYSEGTKIVQALETILYGTAYKNSTLCLSNFNTQILCQSLSTLAAYHLIPSHFVRLTPGKHSYRSESKLSLKKMEKHTSNIRTARAKALIKYLRQNHRFHVISKLINSFNVIYYYFSPSLTSNIIYAIIADVNLIKKSKSFCFATSFSNFSVSRAVRECCLISLRDIVHSPQGGFRRQETCAINDNAIALAVQRLTLVSHRLNVVTLTPIIPAVNPLQDIAGLITDTINISANSVLTSEDTRDDAYEDIVGSKLQGDYRLSFSKLSTQEPNENWDLYVARLIMSVNKRNAICNQVLQECQNSGEYRSIFNTLRNGKASDALRERLCHLELECFLKVLIRKSNECFNEALYLARDMRFGTELYDETLSRFISRSAAYAMTAVMVERYNCCIHCFYLNHGKAACKSYLRDNLLKTDMQLKESVISPYKHITKINIVTPTDALLYLDEIKGLIDGLDIKAREGDKSDELKFMQSNQLALMLNTFQNIVFCAEKGIIMSRTAVTEVFRRRYIRNNRFYASSAAENSVWDMLTVSSSQLQKSDRGKSGSFVTPEQLPVYIPSTSYTSDVNSTSLSDDEHITCLLVKVPKDVLAKIGKTLYSTTETAVPLYNVFGVSGLRYCSHESNFYLSTLKTQSVAAKAVSSLINTVRKSSFPDISILYSNSYFNAQYSIWFENDIEADTVNATKAFRNNFYGWNETGVKYQHIEPSLVSTILENCKSLTVENTDNAVSLFQNKKSVVTVALFAQQLAPERILDLKRYCATELSELCTNNNGIWSTNGILVSLMLGSDSRAAALGDALLRTGEKLYDEFMLLRADCVSFPASEAVESVLSVELDFVNKKIKEKGSSLAVSTWNRCAYVYACWTRFQSAMRSFLDESAASRTCITQTLELTLPFPKNETNHCDMQNQPFRNSGLEEGAVPQLPQELLNLQSVGGKRGRSSFEISAETVNSGGKIRFLNFYESCINQSQQQHLARQIFRIIIKRPDDLCNFVDTATQNELAAVNEEEILFSNELQTLLEWPTPDTRVIYRRYATLFFVFIVDSSESQLAILDLIQVLVETLDKVFENVCELDFIYHSDKVQHVINEIVTGGLVTETNKDLIITAQQEMEREGEMHQSGSSVIPFSSFFKGGKGENLARGGSLAGY